MGYHVHIINISTDNHMWVSPHDIIGYAFDLLGFLHAFHCILYVLILGFSSFFESLIITFVHVAPKTR